MKRIRRYLVAGILVWVPLGVTSALVFVAVRFTDKTLVLIPKQYQPDSLLGFHIPGLGVILALIVLLWTTSLIYIHEHHDLSYLASSYTRISPLAHTAKKVATGMYSLSSSTG